MMFCELAMLGRFYDTFAIQHLIDTKLDNAQALIDFNFNYCSTVCFDFCWTIDSS